MASILFHDPRLSSVSGGGETVTLQLARLLSDAGHQVTLLTRRAEPSGIYNQTLRSHSRINAVEIDVSAEQHVAAHDGPAREFYSADRLAPESLAFNIAAGRFYESRTFDLMVVSFVLDLAGLCTEAPVLLNVFGLPPDEKIAALEAPLLKKTSAFTFASHFVRREFCRLFAFARGVEDGPVIHAGIHELFFGRPTGITKVQDVCYAGRLVHRKGVHVLLEAMARLKQNTGITVTAAIAGEGPEGLRLQTMAGALGIEKQVTWLGAIGTAELLQVLDRSSIFVYPTLKPEAFGCSNLEAMARGLPVITTNLGGTADYVEPGVNALVCETDSPESLADRVEALLNDASLAEKIGCNAVETAQQFHPLRTSQRWLATFDRLLRQVA